jgi:hypothetical protein
VLADVVCVAPLCGGLKPGVPHPRQPLILNELRERLLARVDHDPLATEQRLLGQPFFSRLRLVEDLTLAPLLRPIGAINRGTREPLLAGGAKPLLDRSTKDSHRRCLPLSCWTPS